VTESVLWVNGEYVTADRPVVRADDRGVLYGDGFFDTLRLCGGVPFRLSQHLSRLRESCARFGIEFAVTDEQMREVLGELVSRTGLADAAARTTVTRGAHTGVLGLPPSSSPTVIVQLRPWARPSAELYHRGFRLHVVSFRLDAEHPLSGHKSIHYLSFLAARDEAKRMACDEGLLLNTVGHIAEAATSNVFCVRDGRVLTPPLGSGALPGITRQTVLELCSEEGIPHSEENLTLAQLVKSDEAFLTNSLMGIMPVSAVRKHRLAGPVPGPLTRRLQDSYHRLVEQETGGTAG